MKEEQNGKYTVRWHGIKDENGMMHSPEQLPKDIIDPIIYVILEETARTKINNGIS